MNSRIYLDNNASTSPDPAVVAAVIEYLQSSWGNPSSPHAFGKKSRAQLIQSRDAIANYLNVSSEEIVFTSGATEGANLILQGLFSKDRKGHIITTKLEHSCVLHGIEALERSGCEVAYLPAGEWGAAKAEDLLGALRPDTKLIAIMAVNNETGVKSDISAFAQIAEERGIPLFVDGVALLGKESFTIPPGVSAMCFSGHKIHALQGTGFCFIRRNLKLAPLYYGGSQQFGKRPGTENMPGIVGLAAAIGRLREELPAAGAAMLARRQYFERSLQRFLGDVEVNGTGPRISNTSNLYFPGVDGESLLIALDMAGVAATHASACESGALEPSRVLLEMGMPRSRVHASLRFSLSRMTTQEEIERAVEIVGQTVAKLRR